MIINNLRTIDPWRQVVADVAYLATYMEAVSRVSLRLQNMVESLSNNCFRSTTPEVAAGINDVNSAL